MQQFMSVEKCAEVLRVNKHTLYRAVQRGEVPHSMVGPYIRIPVSFLGIYPPEAARHPLLASQTIRGTKYGEQLELFSMKPVRVWRNTGKPVRLWDYERSKYNF